MRTLQNDQFLYLSSEDSPCNPSTARFDLVMIENSVKSLNSVTQPLHSTLIIDTDNYMINFLCKHLINPLVLHTSPTFREAKYKIENHIIDNVVMEVFTLEESALEALNFIYDMQINYPGIRLTVFTFTRNSYLLQVLRSFHYINIVSKYEPMSELNHAVHACWLDEAFYSQYINDLMAEIEQPDSFDDIEWTVLTELAHSTPTHDIAKIINKRYHTLFYYIKKINKKLHLSTKNEHIKMLKAINSNPLKSASISYCDRFN
ncbi:hypothetical protein [Citrobacter koseri]|uniref:hypothetical protein n=1 Tax=Citrobacter koseri TaxID=545 RepID=UPI001DF24E5F|nr:hypothetical protein [Citrobacter koseri]CAG0276893.1 hypothetical protein AN2353V1_3321 [Citrobacter koseri]CAH6138484.1 hypothetical protein AN2353V1_3321 [Citrobacter koseri]